jgi:hypothetical protein
MMTVLEKILRHARALVVIGGTIGMIAPAALADEAWKPPPPEGYPSGWNRTTAPTPHAYDHKVGTGTMDLKATGQVPATPPTQNAQIIYQMVPGGHRYHRITP